MKYITLIYEHLDEIDKSSKEEVALLIAQHNNLQKQAKQSQAYLGATELQAIDKAVSLRIRNDKVSITDGPFIESKEIFVGFYLFETSNLDKALEWAQMVPTRAKGGLEVRPLDNAKCLASANHNNLLEHIGENITMYALLIYQAEDLFDAYTAKQLQELIHGSTLMAEKAMADGVYVTGNKLMPAVTATTIKTNNKQTSIIDGPFSEAKEVLLGFHVLATQDIAAVLAYAQIIPDAYAGVVEVRPINFYEQDGEKAFQWTHSK